MIGMSDEDCFRKLAEDVCAKVCVLCLRGGSGGGIWCVGRKAEAMGYIAHPESGTCEGMCVYALCSHQFAQCIALCVSELCAVTFYVCTPQIAIKTVKSLFI